MIPPSTPPTTAPVFTDVGAGTHWLLGHSVQELGYVCWHTSPLPHGVHGRISPQLTHSSSRTASARDMAAAGGAAGAHGCQVVIRWSKRRRPKFAILPLTAMQAPAGRVVIQSRAIVVADADVAGDVTIGAGACGPGRRR